METVINLHQDFHPETARLIIAGILFIPFVYLLTYKPAKKALHAKDIPGAAILTRNSTNRYPTSKIGITLT